VIDQLPKPLAVAGAAAIVGTSYRIALLYQLADFGDLGAVDVAVNAAVYQDQERQFRAGGALLGGEGIAIDDDGILGARRGRVFDVPRRRSRVAAPVELRDPPEAAEEAQI